MKAVLHTAYGPAEELQVTDVDKPTPKDDEVLIKIRATTVTSSDCNVRNFTFVPKSFRLPAKLKLGLNKPKINILGIDLAGEIEALGKDVTRFKKGDRVFGTPDVAMGAHAEYICLPETSVLASKPENLSWEEAATLPLAGNTALYFLRELGEIKARQEVLINGASGAVGSFAVQLAKHFGAVVTGVCSTKNLELVRSLGADEVVDYTKEDFTENGKVYDIIFDAVSKLSYSHCKGSLKTNGAYLATLPTGKIILQSIWTSIRGGKRVKFGDASPRQENLDLLAELAGQGKLKPVIDRNYPLEEIVEAFRYVEKGHKKGSVVVTVAV